MSIPRPAEAPSGVQTLMGAEVGQLNLRGVQTRAAELHKTIDSLIQILQFAPASLQWCAPTAPRCLFFQKKLIT